MLARWFDGIWLAFTWHLTDSLASTLQAYQTCRYGTKPVRGSSVGRTYHDPTYLTYPNLLPPTAPTAYRLLPLA
jgi:hypothetical protein